MSDNVIMFSKAQIKAQLKNLSSLLNLDKDPNKPKKMMVNGVYTSKFLKWNKKLIKDGFSQYYADTDYFFNPITRKFIKYKYDKRYKDKKIVRKETTKKIESIYSVLENNTSKEYKKKFKNDFLSLKFDTDLLVDLRNIKYNDLLNTIADILPYDEKGNAETYVATAYGDGVGWITLSPVNLMRLINRKELTTEKEFKHGSDVNFIMRTINNGGKIIIRRNRPFEDDITEAPSGAFFKYYNKTCFDLSRYDIYNEKQKNYNDNCLFIALKNSNKLEEKKLNQIKEYFRNGIIPTSKMNAIAKVLNICISVSRKINDKTKTFFYGEKDTEIIKIGLIDEHYILIEETEITKFALEHYEEIKHIKDFNKIYKQFKGQYKKSNTRFINSIEVVRTLLKNTNLIEKIPLSDLMDTQFFTNNVNNENLEYNDTIFNKHGNPTGNLKINETLKTDNLDLYRVFYDFETNTHKNESINHTPYLMRFETEDGIKGGFNGSFCGRLFINYLKSLKKEKILLIAHNQRYDFTFICEYITCLSPILKGNRLMGGGGRIYRGKGDYTELIFQDSLNLIPERLSNFGSMFNLKQEKELMAYDMYNTENIKKKYLTIEKCLEYFKNDDDKKTFINNCNKFECIDDDVVNIIKYSSCYCEIDVSVMKAGYNQFREDIKVICNLDIINYCSIASLANDFMVASGCFDDCYALSGVPRAFIQKFIVGGKVMVANNEKTFKTENEKPLADFDGVSLYPSSMNRIKGYLKGKPKILQPENLNKEFLFSSGVDGFFVKVVCLNDSKIKRAFPPLSRMNEDGIRNFSNETEGNTYYLDKTSFEDCEKFSGLEFKIIQGYYYNEGHNDKVNEVITTLFNERLKKKSEGNVIQKVYKLIMNSAYGKTLLKPIDEDVDVIYKKNWDKYLSRNYNFIKEFSPCGDNYIVKKIKTIGSHFNNCYAGVEVLTMSKRIMNEVMYCAEDKNIELYYTDTDSIHMNYDDVEPLSKYFNEKYNRVLCGKQLGQFHIDFDLAGSVGDIKSIKSVFLGKKCYMDLLESKDKDGNVIYGEHLRMKGIPEASIHYTCKIRGQTPYDLYMDLYEGKEVLFDLLCGGDRVNFKYNKDFSVKSLGMGINGESEFTRTMNRIKV